MTVLVLLVLTLLAGCGRTPAAGAPADPVSLQRVSRAWPVMGTMLVVTAWGRDTAAMLAALHAARDSVRLVDSLMSSYRSTSEISTITRHAGGMAVRVSPQTMHVVLAAYRYWRLSGGAFDPTVGPLVAAWGFRGDSAIVPSAARLDSLRALVGFDRIEIDTARGTVRLPLAGMQLDFGGIAKGYALDLARAAMDAPTISGGMVDLGGNVLVFGTPPGGGKWHVGIVHPRRDGAILGVVAIDSGAIATSGDYEHFFMIDGVRHAHLIDPRSGRPARGVIAATAIGPRGEWSDGLSAALFLTGPVRGVALADSLSGTGALFVVDRGTDDVTLADLVLSTRARVWFTPRVPPR